MVGLVDWRVRARVVRGVSQRVRGVVGGGGGDGGVCVESEEEWEEGGGEQEDKQA